MIRPPPRSTLFPSPPLFRSELRKQLAAPRPPASLNQQIAALTATKRSYGKIQALWDLGPPPRTFLYRRGEDRKSTRLNSSHSQISYAVFCLKKKTQPQLDPR